MPSPIIVSVHDDFRRLEAKLSDLDRNQIPFAASQAANRLSKIGLADLIGHMDKDFDRPTPYTKRGFYTRLGTKRDPHGEILSRDFAAKGTPASEYLAPEIMGGGRALKKFERAIGGKVGGAQYIVPGSGAQLDSYGNVSRGRIVQIMSALGVAEGHAGYQANRTAKSARRGKAVLYFVAYSHRDGKPLAIYQVVGKGKVKPVLVFARAKPHYKVRLRFFSIIETSVRTHSPQVFDEELAKAIATAR